MTIKAWLAGGLAIVTTVGTAVIASDVGTAIDRHSNMKDMALRQQLRQKQAEWEAEQTIREELLQEKIDFQESVWYTLRYATPVVLVATFATTLYLFHGWTDAQVRKSKFEATQIKMDPVTRSFPMIVFEAGNRLRLHDPNTKRTMALDIDHEADPLLVAHSTAVQLQSMAKQNEEVHLPALLEMANDYLITDRREDSG